MNELTFNYKDEAFTDSVILAHGAGIEHRAVVQLITTHLDDVSEFGKVTFQMLPSPESKTGQKMKICRLNKEQATVLYDATTIAEHLGIMSKSNKPHAQAVTSIISALDIDESERTLTPYSRNGHDGESVQYTLSVEQKVAGWLNDNNYPVIIDGNDKKYTVKYRAR